MPSALILTWLVCESTLLFEIDHTQCPFPDLFPSGEEFEEAGFSGDGYLQVSLQTITPFSRFVELTLLWQMEHILLCITYKCL